MRIALLNPPFLNKYSRSSRSPAVTKSGTIYYPLWLSYAAGVLDRSGHELILIDAPAKGLGRQDVLDRLIRFLPDLVVIDTSTPSIKNDLACAEEIKATLCDTKVCLVGTHVSACVHEILPHEKYIDFIARHEYDYTLKELVEKLGDQSQYGTIAGISWVKDGIVVDNTDRAFIENLDELPFVSEVYKKYLDIENYFYAHVNFPTISIFSSRGCPSRCFYCMYSQVMFGKNYRRRSAKNLFEECAYISREFPQVKEILIDDDNFAVDQENVKDFCRLMIEKRVRLKWTVQVRVNLELETMVLMRKAGCKLLVAGFESGNQSILENMKKGITIEQSLLFDENARKARIKIHGCFMVGNPGETKKTMKETLDFSMKLHLDTVQFFPLMVYPGTEAYAWAKSNKHMDTDDYTKWLKIDGMHNCVVSTDAVTSKELTDFCDYARSRFYLRPRYILYKLIQSVTNIDDAVRTIKAFKTFKRYLFRGAKM